MKIQLLVNEKLTSNTVGQGLAPAVEINVYMAVIGCYQINDYMKIKPSSDEEGGTPQA